MTLTKKKQQHWRFLTKGQYNKLQLQVFMEHSLTRLKLN